MDQRPGWIRADRKLIIGQTWLNVVIFEEIDATSNDTKWWQ